MSTRQLNIGDFAAHCLDEIQALQHGDTVLEIFSGGRIVATVNPVPHVNDGGTLEDWMGSGAGTVVFAPGVDPEAPVLMFADEAAAQDFWHPLTAQQHAALQKVPIVSTAEAFYGDGDAADWEGFDEALEQWRSEQLPTGDEPHAA